MRESKSSKNIVSRKLSSTTGPRDLLLSKEDTMRNNVHSSLFQKCPSSDPKEFRGNGACVEGFTMGSPTLMGISEVAKLSKKANEFEKECTLSIRGGIFMPLL